jgi:GNAT superfamily N-acetyltransferase
MVPEDSEAVVTLLATLVRGGAISEHANAYGGAGDDAAILRAVHLLMENPQLGFIWLTEERSQIVGLVVVCFAVSTNLGKLVAKVPDFVVREDARGRGAGRFLISSLVDELRKLDIGRIDLGVHDTNVSACKFYERVGFVKNHELGMSLVLR